MEKPKRKNKQSTNFNFYGAIWADWIMQDFQNYVLNTVKTRIEIN